MAEDQQGTYSSMKIIVFIFCLCIAINPVYAEDFILKYFNNQRVENKPPTIKPYQVPSFTGATVDWNNIKPAIEPKKKINGDVIFQIINKCYPLKSGFGLEVSLRSGLNYKPSTKNTNGGNDTVVQTYDSQNYYAGIVANMPLYSDVEIDKERKLEYQRRMQTTETIKGLLTAVATKRRAERLMELYTSLELRARARVRESIASTEEQITYLEKVATTQGDLDAAEAAIVGSRLALIGQCRSEVVEEVNNYILLEIGEKPNPLEPSVYDENQ
jgi:hypothetical protein